MLPRHTLAGRPTASHSGASRELYRGTLHEDVPGDERRKVDCGTDVEHRGESCGRRRQFPCRSWANVREVRGACLAPYIKGICDRTLSAKLKALNQGQSLMAVVCTDYNVISGFGNSSKCVYQQHMAEIA